MPNVRCFPKLRGVPNRSEGFHREVVFPPALDEQFMEQTVVSPHIIGRPRHAARIKKPHGLVHADNSERLTVNVRLRFPFEYAFDFGFTSRLVYKRKHTVNPCEKI